jgi:hypothetical protein
LASEFVRLGIALRCNVTEIVGDLRRPLDQAANFNRRHPQKRDRILLPTA